MLKIEILKKNNEIICIECDGHTGYGASGEDIVCAAASSIVQAAALGVLQVARVAPKLKQDAKLGYFKMEIPQETAGGQMHDVQVILGTMLCGLRDLTSEYSDFILLEVKDVY